MKKYSSEINQIVNYGLDSIDSNDKIEISLKDFVKIYKTFEEFNRFFHQPLHYETLEDVQIYIGNRDKGAYSLVHEMYYKTLDKYITGKLKEILEDDEGLLTKPGFPYYYK